MLSIKSFKRTGWLAQQHKPISLVDDPVRKVLDLLKEEVIADKKQPWQVITSRGC